MPWPVWTIWTVNALMQWGVLALILWHSAWRHHPAFTSYIAFCTCKTSFLMWVAGYKIHLYFALNTSLKAIALLLLIAVFIELFAAVFRPYSTLPKGTLYWFRMGFGFVILLSTAVAFLFPASGARDFMNTVIVLNRSASIIFCGAFGITALTSFYFGIPWQQRTYGIGTGFLLYMSVDLFCASLAAPYGPNVRNALNIVTMLGYSLALVTWIIYFVRKDSPPRTLSMEQLQLFQVALDDPMRKVESFRNAL